MENWSIKAKVKRDEVATYKRWYFGQHVLIEIKSRLGLPMRWIAARVEDSSEVLISRHRSRNAAERVCEKGEGQ